MNIFDDHNSAISPLFSSLSLYGYLHQIDQKIDQKQKGKKRDNAMAEEKENEIINRIEIEGNKCRIQDQ